MLEASDLFLAATGGLVLGAVFFGGLWWTIRRGLSSTAPAALFLGSFLLRTALALAGFYLASRGDWRRLLACLAGFIVARVVVTRLTRNPGNAGVAPLRGGSP